MRVLSNGVFILFVFAMLLGDFLAGVAEAIPVFARRYEIGCPVCHVGFPKLNDFGEAFAGNGYQFPGEDLKDHAIDVGDDKLLLLKQLPLAIRADSFFRARADTGTNSDFEAPFGIKILSSAPIAQNISYYFYFFFNERGDVSGVEDAFIYFNNGYKDVDLDLRFGQFQVSDILFPREQRLTFQDFTYYVTAISASNFRLTYDRIIELSYNFDLTDDLARSISRQDGAAADLQELEDKLADLRAEAGKCAAELHELRAAGADRVARQAREIIAPLALPDIDFTFAVSLDTDPQGELTLAGVSCRATGRGADRVELLVRTNQGESPGALGQIASGGERSRIFLGLSVMALVADAQPLMLFDEIDAGLGMDNAVPVARLLEQLAQSGQILCITHLPTVAARGRAHLVVEKCVTDGRTALGVTERRGEARVAEIIRLLGGQQGTPGGSTSQDAYARELLGSQRGASEA